MTTTELTTEAVDLLLKARAAGVNWNYAYYLKYPEKMDEAQKSRLKTILKEDANVTHNHD